MIFGEWVIRSIKLKTSIKLALQEEGKKEIEEILIQKKSLNICRNIREEGGSFYVFNLTRKWRGAVAWARLGRFI